MQSNQDFNKDDKLFIQIYIEITRLFTYKPSYEQFEGIIRFIELRIT